MPAKKPRVEITDPAARRLYDRLKSEGLLPLEVMLAAMRHLVESKQIVKAAIIARDAAPYVHARLSSVAHTGPDGGDLKVDNRIEIVFVQAPEPKLPEAKREVRKLQ